MEKGLFFQHKGLDIYMQKANKWKNQKPTCRPIPFTKINSEWITALNIKHQTITLLEDNTGENLDVLGHGNDFQV